MVSHRLLLPFLTLLLIIRQLRVVWQGLRFSRARASSARVPIPREVLSTIFRPPFPMTEVLISELLMVSITKESPMLTREGKQTLDPGDSGTWWRFLINEQMGSNPSMH